GCEGCDCSPTGVRPNVGTDCDRQTGQCTCKPRIGGRQCDRCAAGFYGFPECVRCDCDQGGVTADVCHPDTGQCLCKRNTHGVRCDSCKDGSFHFNQSNPSGCIRCFCFGATDQCQSSTKRRGKFVDMRGWRLVRADQGEVALVLNPSSNTLVADVQELPDTTQLLHWVAPKSYLGDRVSSYGGYLTYQAKTFGIPSEGMVLLESRPDILLNSRDMAVVHMVLQIPGPDRLYQGRVQLVEGNWRHAGTNRPVSRADLMTVLAELEGLRIRALYYTQSQRLSLGEVGLEEATDHGVGGPASTVERCVCPPLYRGDSCQKCAPGYYRASNGPNPGHCVPCSCNNLATQCDQWTGRCLNCQYNTAGDRCERCREGYYGDAAKRSCRICPCPLKVQSNSFAVGCSEVAGGFRCDCQTGYGGDRCERCAPGYYGDPMVTGGSCRPCDCRGNLNSCDSRTGVCKNTLEPGDTDTNEPCQECDNCALTLLNDLEHLEEELERIKTLLDNANFSTSSLDQLRELEKVIAETKTLVNNFNSTISNQEINVSQLELDTNTLETDVTALKRKADEREISAEKLVEELNKTNKRAEVLDADAKNLLQRILDLIEKLKQSGGGVVPSKDLEIVLAEAERMVKEMQKRNFNPQKDAAEKEKDEAQKLLNYIKNNVTNQYEKNYAAANRTRGLLNNYEEKLKELEEALKQAKETVKTANTQNGLNEKELEDILKRMKDLEKERDRVKQQISDAKDQLKETEGLLRMLEDSKKEYEQLAAQLDGARINLTNKVNTLSQAAAKEDLVKRAEEHAKMLNELAMELADAVRNASDRADVRNAIDIIQAYKNITDAINAAERAANMAKDAADKALNDVEKEDLTKKALNLKDQANNLLNDAKTAEDDLRRASDDLKAQRKRLRDAERKKKALEKDLLDAQTELNNINRDDIRDMLAEAKTKAASANDTSATTIDKLNKIKDEVAKINVNGSDSNGTVNMDDVDKLVKNLLNTIPTLEDKINKVEDLSLQLPVANISENINRIKELIEQARDAANRVVVPMKFNGEGHVELRTPLDVEDLRAYTALSMFLSLAPKITRGDGARRRRQSTDDGNTFVLYLGNKHSPRDYIGMYLSDDVLYTVYSLGGEENTVMTQAVTRSSSPSTLFDKVDLHRIYENAEMIFTPKFLSSKPDPAVQTSKQGNVNKNLLTLDPTDVVFYVGGYPSDFIPPASLNYPNYTGCIELSIFGDRFISLYNFKNAVNVNPEPPCTRYVPSETAEFFEGTGYAKVSLDTEKRTPVLPMHQLITTHSNGVLLYTGNETVYYCVTIERGHVVISSNILENPVRSASKVFPAETEFTKVLVILQSVDKQIIVRVGNKAVVEAPMQYTPGDFPEYYIGGLPQSLRERFNITVQPLKSCIKDLRLNGKFTTALEKVGVSRGCPGDFLASRKAQFNAGSTLSGAVTGFSQANDVRVSLGFKSSEKEGLLLQNTQLDTAAIELSLVDGYVVLTFKGANRKSWTSSKRYQDGKWHYLTAIWRAASQSIELQIDGVDVGQETPSRDFDLSPETMILGKNMYKGCLSNLFLGR
ncbi:hypothetical protein DPEC_G00065200, partial [Dallia pectoralis]